MFQQTVIEKRKHAKPRVLELKTGSEQFLIFFRELKDTNDTKFHSYTIINNVNQKMKPHLIQK